MTKPRTRLPFLALTALLAAPALFAQTKPVAFSFSISDAYATCGSAPYVFVKVTGKAGVTGSMQVTAQSGDARASVPFQIGSDGTSEVVVKGGTLTFRCDKPDILVVQPVGVRGYTGQPKYLSVGSVKFKEVTPPG